MRKRSGGIHCQTEQEFIELAELSQQKCGLYYDDHLNNYKFHSKKPKESNPQSSEDMDIQSNFFADFDFSQEITYLREEQSILKNLKYSYKQSQSLILTINPTKIKEKMKKLFPIKSLQSIPQFSRGEIMKTLSQFSAQNVNISTKKNKQSSVSNSTQLFMLNQVDQKKETIKIHKYWIFDPNKISTEILKIYKKKAITVYSIDKAQNSAQNIQIQRPHAKLVQVKNEVTVIMKQMQLGEMI